MLGNSCVTVTLPGRPTAYEGEVPPERVVEIHGTMREVTCMACGQRAPMERALARVRAGEEDPALARFDHYFDDLFRVEAHMRSGDVEEVLGLARDVFSGPYATYGALVDSDLVFRPAIAVACSMGASTP